MFIKDISSITKLIFLIICYFLLQTSFANELKKSNYKKLKEIEEKLLINQEIYFELIKLEKELVLNLNNVNKTPPLVDLVVNQDKYSLILKHYFYKNFKNNNKNLAKFIIETNLSFNTSNTLSVSGNNS